MVCVLLVAGCNDCVYDNHIVNVVKISQNGTPLWTRVIDTGIDNRVSGFTPTNDGGIVTAGSISKKTGSCVLKSQPHLIRFSDNGKILWDKIIDSDANIADTIIQLRDGGFVVILNTGEILKLDSGGKTIWNRSIDTKPERSSIIEIESGELVVASSFLMKLDSNGTILWQRSLENEKLGEIYSIIEMKNGQGYVVNSFAYIPNWSVYSIKFNQDGLWTTASLIADNGLFISHPLYSSPKGYSNIYSDSKLGISIMQFNNNGILINKYPINATRYVIQTKDLGFFSIGDSDQSAFKLKPDGTKEWNLTFLHSEWVDGLAQSADEGYFVLYDTIVPLDMS